MGYKTIAASQASRTFLVLNTPNCDILGYISRKLKKFFNWICFGQLPPVPLPGYVTGPDPYPCDLPVISETRHPCSRLHVLIYKPNQTLSEISLSAYMFGSILLWLFDDIFLTFVLVLPASLSSVAKGVGRGGGRTAPGDTDSRGGVTQWHPRLSSKFFQMGLVATNLRNRIEYSFSLFSSHKIVTRGPLKSWKCTRKRLAAGLLWWSLSAPQTP